MTNPLFLNTVLLGGTTADKLNAARRAGFDQIELWRQDVDSFAGGAEAVRARLASLSLGLTDHQVLMDFDGAPDDARDGKRAEAIAMLDIAVAVGAGTLLVPASTDSRCQADRIVPDLSWLTQVAAERGLRIAYEGMAWSTINHSLPACWDAVQRVEADNLDLVVDAFHIFARGRDLSDLDGIPADRIALVQLSDLADPVALDEVKQVARHRRLLPGEGHFPLIPLLERLSAMHYTGPIGLEVFNDDLHAAPPLTAATRAMTALREVLAMSGV